MVVACWSAKGGVGTTVIASAMAVRAAEQQEVLLVDLVGDVPAVLGQPDPAGPGLAEWCSAGTEVPVDALERLELPITDSLGLVPRGAGDLDRPERAEVLSGLLTNEPRLVMVDCGCLVGPACPVLAFRQLVAQRARHAVLVTRACYLGLRHATAAPVRPTEVVLVAEDGRSLDADDVAAVLNVEVSCQVPFDPSIARAVDAGLLMARLPRVLAKALGSTHRG